MQIQHVNVTKCACNFQNTYICRFVLYDIRWSIFIATHQNLLSLCVHCEKHLCASLPYNSLCTFANPYVCIDSFRHCSGLVKKIKKQLQTHETHNFYGHRNIWVRHVDPQSLRIHPAMKKYPSILKKQALSPVEEPSRISHYCRLNTWRMCEMTGLQSVPRFML